MKILKSKMLIFLLLTLGLFFANKEIDILVINFNVQNNFLEKSVQVDEGDGKVTVNSQGNYFIVNNHVTLTPDIKYSF